MNLGVALMRLGNNRDASTAKQITLTPWKILKKRKVWVPL